MTWDESIFSFFTPKKGGFVPYGDDKKGRINGTSTIGKFLNPTIGKKNYGLKHDFLSIIQLWDKCNNATFDSFGNSVIKSKSNKTLFRSSRSGHI